MRNEYSMKWAGLMLAAIFVAGSVGLAAQNQPEIRKFVFTGGGEGSWLGVEIKDVTPALEKQFKLPGDYGAIVGTVEPGSPAAKAGIQKDDVILEFAGERVLSVATLRRLVSETPPGRTVTAEISRDGAIQNLQVTPEKHEGNNFYFNGPDLRGMRRFNMAPDFKAMPLPNAEAPGTQPFLFRFFNTHPVLGIEGADLTPQLARFFGVAQGKGVLVQEVTQGSPAAKAGLKAGDVITKVGSQEVGSVEELRNALGEDTDQARKVMLTIVRDHNEKTMTVQLEPERNQDIRKIESWRNLGISQKEAEQLAKQARQIAADYQAKADQYQKEFGRMEQQLRIQLLPLKQNLQQEIEQMKQKAKQEIRHEMKDHPRLQRDLSA